MARNHSETKLHICVAEWLMGACSHVLWTHPANQGRSPQEGAKLKKMGVRAGVADLIFWHEGKFMAIELKTESGMSPVQKEFKRRFEQAGGLFAICTSVKEVRDTIVLWGITPLAYPMKEPLPPLSVRYKAAMDFYKP